MHICIVSPRLYFYLDPTSESPAGGSQRQQYLLTRELTRRGIPVSAVVGEYGQPDYTLYQNVPTIKGVPESIDSSRQIPRAFYSLFTAMKKSGADIFYVRGAPRLFVATSLIAQLLQKSVVFSVANDRDLDREYLSKRYHPLFQQSYFWSLRFADGIVTQTETQKKILKHRFGFDSVHIPNGYDLPTRDELIPHSERDSVLWVGTSDPDQKKPLRFVDVARKLPSISFDMVSKPKTDDPQHHQTVKEKAKSTPNLRFHGAVGPQDVHEFYRRATMLVNTSKYEGFPNTFLEAWRYQTPVISEHFSLPELPHKMTKYLNLDPDDELSHIIKTLHTDPNKREEVGYISRRYMDDNYNINSVMRQYVQLFRNIDRS